MHVPLHRKYGRHGRKGRHLCCRSRYRRHFKRSSGRIKKQNPHIQIVAVEPDNSPVLSGGNPGLHKIQGIGAGFIPHTYNEKLVDKIIRVKDDDAIRTGRELSLTEGLLVGISSGAAAYAALELAKLPENEENKL